LFNVIIVYKFVSRLCPDYLQLQYGIWETSIADVTFTCLKPVFKSAIFELSTNLVQGHSFSVSRRLCKENIILCTTLFNKDNQLTVHSAPVLKWFIVNNVPNEYLTIFIDQKPKKIANEANFVLISVTILLRRIA